MLHEASPPPSLEAYALKAVIGFLQGTKLEQFFHRRSPVRY
jgi:hypothetical protein